MINEFGVWLLVVGLVVGAGLTWFVVADLRRRDEEVGELERAQEAMWVASVLRREGRSTDDETVERILALHRVYLESPPPDAQDAPTSTGSGPMSAPSAPTRETPNLSGPVEPATAGDGPTQ